MPIYRLGFALQQSSDYQFHGRNLQHWISADGSIVPTWIPFASESTGGSVRTPIVRASVALQAGWHARSLIHEARKRGSLDGLLFHPEAATLFAASTMAELPSVVSCGIRSRPPSTVQGPAGRIAAIWVRMLTRKALGAAKHLVVWDEGSRQALIAHSGVRESKVTVIPPGIDLGRWSFQRFPGPKARPARILFVTPELEGSGVEVIVRAIAGPLKGRCDLDILTQSATQSLRLDGERVSVGGVRVHTELASGFLNQMSLFESADIFVVPATQNPYLAGVMEAMAAELPIVAPASELMNEMLEDQVSGLIVEPGSSDAIVDSLCRLAEDPELRRTIGWAARRRAEEKFSASRNYPMLIELYKRCADGAC